jgi:hypothetical protein
LNFELDTYLDALQAFPDYADNLQTVMGQAFLIKKDIFKNLMWYTLPNNTKHYPLTIERVKEIKNLNKQGIAVEELQAVEVTSGKPKEVEPDFVDVVGQISLKSLEKNDRRRRDQQRFNNNDRRPNNDRPNNDRPNNDRPGPNRPGGQAGNSGGGRPMNNNRPPMNRPNNGPNNGPGNGPSNGPRPNNNRPPMNRPNNGPNNGPTTPPSAN